MGRPQGEEIELIKVCGNKGMNKESPRIGLKAVTHTSRTEDVGGRYNTIKDNRNVAGREVGDLGKGQR